MIKAKSLLLCLSMLLTLACPVSGAQMSSSSYRISTTVLSGGGTPVSSASYGLISTLGQSSPLGGCSSAGFIASSGFWFTLSQVGLADINGDGDVGLEDLILALQIATGQAAGPVFVEADMDGDGRISIVEGIIILRQLSAP